MSNKPVVTSYLEMTSVDDLCPKAQISALEVNMSGVDQYQFNRFLYQFVGESWGWTDKLSWSDEQWQALVESESHQTWVAYCHGGIAGYYELLRDGDDVEILYFGLTEQFIGKGLGGDLLTRAIQSAWCWSGVSRVWVHTCTLDHPSALSNYQKRGFRVYKEEVEG